MLGKLKLYIIESYRELTRVNWPTKNDTIKMVGLVVFISFVVAAYLGLLDAGFLYGVDKLISISK
jgi:preprotein translocase SecE subunit